MRLPMERHKRHSEIRKILLDPLTWGQPNRAIARFTRSGESTVRMIRQRLIADGLTPANPHSDLEAQKRDGAQWHRSHA